MAHALTGPGCRPGFPVHRLRALVEVDVDRDAGSSREAERRRGPVEQQFAVGAPPDGPADRAEAVAVPVVPARFAPGQDGGDLGAVPSEVAVASAGPAPAPGTDVVAGSGSPRACTAAGRAAASDDLAALDRVVDRICSAGLLLQAAMQPVGCGDAVERAVLELDQALEELRLAVASGAGRRRRRRRPAGRQAD